MVNRLLTKFGRRGLTMLNSHRAPATESVACDAGADPHNAALKRQTVRSRQRHIVQGSNPSTLAERMDLLHAINLDPELSASAVVVALALMSFVNSKTGECFPTFESIAERSRVSKRTVATATQDLELRGWVAIERDEGGDREANRYHFAFDRVRKPGLIAGAGLEAVVSGKLHGENSAPRAGAHGAKSASDTVQNPPDDGENFAPKLQEDNSLKRTQDAADAAMPPTAAEQERELFRRGKGVLGQNAGGLIKKLLKAKTGSVELARAAVETAATKQDPRETSEQSLGVAMRQHDETGTHGYEDRL